MPTKTEAIKRFLEANSQLANLYSFEMECQVNVSQNGGEIIEGDYKGKRWRGYTDGLTTWKPFRIPWGAASEPHYEDSEIKFDLTKHVEAIGLTGWNWKNRVSRFVAFDFDSIVGHKAGLSNEELEKIKQIVLDIPWVTLRYSSGGKGLHVYVFLNDVPTANHNEHAALARAILGIMSGITGFDFQAKVDTCGGNIWIWHKKSTNAPGAFVLLKQGEILESVPINWKDHIAVVTRKKAKNTLEVDEEYCNQHKNLPLDDEHKKLIQYLQENKCQWWWDNDRNLLVAHTYDLKQAHTKLNFKGIFETIATGKEHPDINCFCYALKNGAWSIQRFSKGVQEHVSWRQTKSGYTQCYYNRNPDLKTVSDYFEGVEDTKGRFCFNISQKAEQAIKKLGIDFKLPEQLTGRQTKLHINKSGKLVLEIEKTTSDTNVAGYVAEKKYFTKVFDYEQPENESTTYDNFIRHLITESGEDYGWRIKANGQWNNEPYSNIKIALESLGVSSNDSKNILGSSVIGYWTKVNKPFQPEYPTPREWNLGAAQLRYTPSTGDSLKYDSWLKILEHCGSGLNDVIKDNEWCKENGIINGADYLKCWIASIFQTPEEPLPYLFFYGPQNSGKSIFHEALELLITNGYIRADAAITSTGNFNGELENAILCIVEETNLKQNRTANNKIKDWVTARQILVHKKGEEPYLMPNYTHWIQCNNDHDACPIFSGDSRITMIYVPELPTAVLVPKRILIPALQKEAPDFLTEILRVEIPQSSDRLHIPVITTHEKTITEAQNETPLQDFIKEHCIMAPGYAIKFSEFYERFKEFLDAPDVGYWTKHRIGKELPPQFPKGRSTWDNNQLYIGNITWAGTTIEKKARYIVVNAFLRQAEKITV